MCKQSLSNCKLNLEVIVDSEKYHVVAVTKQALYVTNSTTAMTRDDILSFSE